VHKRDLRPGCLVNNDCCGS